MTGIATLSWRVGLLALADGSIFEGEVLAVEPGVSTPACRG